MPEIGSTVLFLDGTSGKEVEAEVVSVNDDLTINILYPHPFAADVRADASQVEAGFGVWQWHAKGRKTIEEAPPVKAPVEELPSAESGAGVTIHRKVTTTNSRGHPVDAP